MRRLSMALALLLIAPWACAQVYTWTDAHGTVHYSQTPPPAGIKYGQVDLNAEASAPAVAKNSSTAASGPPISNDSAPLPPMPDNPENRAKFCALLKASISTLQDSGPVVMRQGEQQQLLDAEQRKQQLIASQSQYNQYCSQP